MEFIKNLISGRADSHRYVFHHIPKCGGNSITTALSKWFHCIYDYRKTWSMGEEFRQFQAAAIDPAQLRAKDLLCGHYDLPGIYLHERYPEILTGKPYRIFTFVRDPLALKLSLAQYEKKRGVLEETAALEEQLFDRPNYLAERFPCTEGNYREVLDRYYFIGLTAQLQESVDTLADLIGRPRVKVERVNVTGREKVELPDATRTRFREENRLDYLIYDECCRRFEEFTRQASGK